MAEAVSAEGLEKPTAYPVVLGGAGDEKEADVVSSRRDDAHRGRAEKGGPEIAASISHRGRHAVMVDEPPERLHAFFRKVGRGVFEKDAPDQIEGGFEVRRQLPDFHAFMLPAVFVFRIVRIFFNKGNRCVW